MQQPIENKLAYFSKINKPHYTKAILQWENQLTFFDKTKQEWLEKTNWFDKQ